MGLYDSVFGEVQCPYCHGAAEVEIQTHALENRLTHYTAGDVVADGPLWSGLYGRHSQLCISCDSKFFPVFRLDFPVISSVSAVRFCPNGRVDLPGSRVEDLFEPDPIDDDYLCRLIATNAIALAPMIHNNEQALRNAVDWKRRLIDCSHLGSPMVRIYGYLSELYERANNFDALAQHSRHLVSMCTLEHELTWNWVVWRALPNRVKADPAEFARYFEVELTAIYQWLGEMIALIHAKRASR